MTHKHIHTTTRIIVIVLIAIAFMTGNVIVQFGGMTEKLYTNNDIISHYQKYELVTGQLLISPIDSGPLFHTLLASADQSIKLQTYTFTNNDIQTLLLQEAQEGTDVDVMVENDPYQSYQDTFTQAMLFFSGSDIALISDEHLSTEYLHSKITLIDEKFIIQTANLTNSSFHSNREHFFVSDHTGVLHSLEKLFAHDWEGQSLRLEDIHPNLVVCPINCRVIIEHLLRHAQESIVIQTQYITDSSLFSILQDQSALDVQIVVADTDSNDRLLRYLGPQVVRALADPYNHTKMMLIDDDILLLGSINMSANSMDNNREVGIIITDPNVIRSFKTQFAIDRRAAEGKR